MAKTNVYRNGLVHVMKRQCDTCIFRPGNLMHLEPGRVEQMVEEATPDGCIPCHKTTHGAKEQEAVCRGFYDKHRTWVLQLARQMNIIEEVNLDG